MSFNLEPPPQPVPEVNSWEWRNWFNRLWRKANNPLVNGLNFNTSFTFNQTVGDGTTGSVSDAQTFGDGNEFVSHEVNSTPGNTLEVNFTEVTSLIGITANFRYTGITTHHVDVSIYNYTTSSLVHIRRIETSTEDVMMTVLFPDAGDYYDTSGNAQVVFNHPDAGNTSHDFYIDYIALLS